MTVITSRALVISLCLLLPAAPALGQRFIARTPATVAQDQTNAMVDAATRAHSIDPTDPTRMGTRDLTRRPERALTPGVARALFQARDFLQGEAPMRALNALRMADQAIASAYDKYRLNQLFTVIYLKLGDNDAALAAAQAAADSAVIPDEDRQQIFSIAAMLAISARHYDAAARYAVALEAMDPADERTRALIGEARYFNGDMGGAVAVLQQLVDAAVGAGRKPDQAILEIVLSAQAQSRDPEGAARTLALLKGYYNDPRNWQKMIDTMHQIDLWNDLNRAADLKAKGLLPGGT